VIDSVADGLIGREMAVSNLELKKQYGHGVPSLITDRNQLRQVLLKRVAVSDSGKGISPEELEKIYMPFFTTKKVGKKTGLVLSMSHGIVKSMGKHMAVESTVERGSTFTIVLPGK